MVFVQFFSGFFCNGVQVVQLENQIGWKSYKDLRYFSSFVGRITWKYVRPWLNAFLDYKVSLLKLGLTPLNLMF